MLNLLFSQLYHGETKLVSTAFNQLLPKLYAISMMWTLNERHSIRAVHYTTGVDVTGSNDATRPHSRRIRSGGVRLSLIIVPYHI